MQFAEGWLYTSGSKAVEDRVETFGAKAIPRFAGIPDSDHPKPFVGRPGNVDHQTLGGNSSEGLREFAVRVPRRRNVLYEGVAHPRYASSVRLTVPPLPSHVAFRPRAARARCFVTNLPTNDHTVSDPLLLYALKLPSALIGN